MKVLFAASEAVPFAKSGGLGDVIGSLPKELCRQGHDVRVILPLSKEIKNTRMEQLEFVGCRTIPLSWRNQYCGLFRTEYEGVIFYFIDNEQYFMRDGYYGYYDDGERFAFFSKAVLESLDWMEFEPDIIHCHDWQTALIPIYLKTLFLREGRRTNMKTLFTIHNIAYQGRYGMEILEDLLGLDQSDRSLVEMDGDVNLMKGAIVACDRLTTVSPTYAEELHYGYYASGMESVIQRCGGKLIGILNGIDTELYDPGKTAEGVPAAYSAKSLEKKALNKEALQKSMGLEVREDLPVFSVVSRLASHKGLALLTRIFSEMMNLPLQFVLLGAGEAQFEAFFREQAARYPGKVAAKTVFSESLAHNIYAGADFLLMPSISEPCGLSQMISLRYGTVPVVRETGGLRDTVKPYLFDKKEGNGITFSSVNAHDLLGAVERSLDLFRQKEDWNKVRENGMKQDFSWKKSALRYGELYKEL